jgi:hypothetical protein
MNQAPVRGTLFALVLSLAAIAPGALAADARRDADPVQTRSFEVRFRPLSDAAELVGTVLSPEGEVTQQFRLKRLVVRDRVSVLAQVPSLLESFDVPPRNVEVTVNLFLGRDRRDAEAGRHNLDGGISRELRGITETLGDFTKWTAYEGLGARSVTAVEGTEVTLNLSSDYRVVFEIESVPEGKSAAGKVAFKSFSLLRLLRSADGTERTELLYTSRVILPTDRLNVIGTAKSPDSPQALFVGLQATPK